VLLDRSALLSPFRYPGGKTWLVPKIVAWLTPKNPKPELFIEPFAGGCSVGLAVAREKLASQVIFVETDDRVASVWQTILYGDWKWLVARISTFPLTHDSVTVELGGTPATLEQKAFQTLLRNRVSHGGKLAPGSGLLKNGEAGRGLQSRWYPRTLQKRIETIVGMRDRLVFLESDGMDVLREHTRNPRVAFFIDPPYTASGSKPGARLYRNNQLEHEELFNIARSLEGDFLMTYSCDMQIRELAAQNGFQVRALQMRNTRHIEQEELLIGSDLSWFDAS
jgi:DNA adenine methylase